MYYTLTAQEEEYMALALDQRLSIRKRTPSLISYDYYSALGLGTLRPVDVTVPMSRRRDRWGHLNCQ